MWWTSNSFYLVLSIFKGENAIYTISLEKFNIGLNSDITNILSVKLGMMIETSKLYILISVWMILMFIQGHSCIWNRKLQCPFYHKSKYRFGLNSVYWHNLLKLMLNVFCTSTIQGRELCWRDFMKYMCNIMCQNNCETICFKLGMMVNTTKIYSLISLRMTLVFTEGYRKGRTYAVIIL